MRFAGPTLFLALVLTVPAALAQTAPDWPEHYAIPSPCLPIT